MARKADTVYVANADFACELEGQRWQIHQGESVRGDHPILKGRESLFDPAGAGVLSPPRKAPAKSR
jgi:hypothetical protein